MHNNFMTHWWLHLRRLYHHRFSRAKAQAALQKLRIEADESGTTIKAVFTHPFQAAFAVEVADFFAFTKAVNYVTYTFRDPANGNAYEVAVRRIDRPTVANINTVLRAALEQIEAGNDEGAALMARRALERVGYLPF